jgi:hypothetical protein
LSKFSHDADHEVSYNSIFAMGIVGAGMLMLKENGREICGLFFFAKVQIMLV